MGMRITNDHPFTTEELEYLRGCNRDRDIEENAQMFPQDVSVEEDPSDSYGNWKNAELKAEIENRNKLRGENEQIPLGTNKAELVSALEADDEAHPEV
jgi:benzoyl-CoA reductase/2-hydroxyglutaryl-CoA dehydratase subunit BcrC/BadD/HgdB